MWAFLIEGMERGMLRCWFWDLLSCGELWSWEWHNSLESQLRGSLGVLPWADLAQGHPKTRAERGVVPPKKKNP